MDPVMEIDKRMQGMTSSRKRTKGGLFIYDINTGFVAVEVLMSKEAVSMGNAIRSFKGRRTIDLIYSDSCPSLKEEINLMRIDHDFSQAGIAQTNAVMESMVAVILAGTRSLCVTGGAPSCFYLFAARHYCVSRNIVYGAWKKRFGHEFQGKLIPFFA